jgi:hypothetical protein
MTRDQTPAHNTITLGKFAKRLASAVGRFMDVRPPLFSPFLESTLNEIFFSLKKIVLL